jgi:hypothetical protein
MGDLGFVESWILGWIWELGFMHMDNGGNRWVEQGNEDYNGQR